jgi:hypothetical protein
MVLCLTRELAVDAIVGMASLSLNVSEDVVRW